MKPKRKMSTRERWVLSIAPTAAILGIYLYGFAGDLNAGLDKENQHLATVSAPLPPPAVPPALLRARAVLDETRRSVDERQVTLDQLETQVASLPKNVAAMIDDRYRAQEIEHVEAVFAHHGITPVVSEADVEVDSGDQALLAVLAPKLEADTPGAKPLPQVWHCIFDDSTPHFQQALAELSKDDAGSLVPLTLNLVYNPANNGQTRLLELWLLY
jgi:hypothetical protein